MSDAIDDMLADCSVGVYADPLIEGDELTDEQVERAEALLRDLMDDAARAVAERSIRMECLKLVVAHGLKGMAPHDVVEEAAVYAAFVLDGETDEEPADDDDGA